MGDCCIEDVHAFRVSRLRRCRIAVVRVERAVPLRPLLAISSLQFITEVFAHQRMRIEGTGPLRVLLIQQSHFPERIDAPIPYVTTHAIKFGGEGSEIHTCEKRTHRLWGRRSIKEPDHMKKFQLCDPPILLKPPLIGGHNPSSMAPLSLRNGQLLEIEMGRQFFRICVHAAILAR